MKVLLAIGMVFFLLFLPLLIAIAVIALVASGAWLTISGFVTGSLSDIAPGIGLVTCGVAVGVLGWRWVAMWKVGEGRFDAVEPLAAAMAARPRRIQAGAGIPHEMVGHLADGVFDRIVGERRYMPMPPSEDRTKWTYELLGRWHEGRIADHDAALRFAAGEGMPGDGMTFEPLDEPLQAGFFGFSRRLDRQDGMRTLLFYQTEAGQIDLYTCFVPIRPMWHPLQHARIKRGKGRELAVGRLVACSKAALAQLAADLKREA